MAVLYVPTESMVSLTAHGNALDVPAARFMGRRPHDLHLAQPRQWGKEGGPGLHRTVRRLQPGYTLSLH